MRWAVNRAGEAAFPGDFDQILPPSCQYPCSLHTPYFPGSPGPLPLGAITVQPSSVRRDLLRRSPVRDLEAEVPGAAASGSRYRLPVHPVYPRQGCACCGRLSGLNACQLARHYRGVDRRTALITTELALQPCLLSFGPHPLLLLISQKLWEPRCCEDLWPAGRFSWNWPLHSSPWRDTDKEVERKHRYTGFNFLMKSDWK